MNKPTPEKIKQARKDAGLTQAKAAELVHVNLTSWQKWEQGNHQITAGLWELFLIKVGMKNSTT